MHFMDIVTVKQNRYEGKDDIPTKKLLSNRSTSKYLADDCDKFSVAAVSCI